MGVPADLEDLARSGVLSPEGLARAREDLDLPATPRDGDTAVAAYVGARFGKELVERLVDPLLGGVYAGRSEELSFEATLGPLAAVAPAHRSLASAAASLLPSAAGRTRRGPSGAGYGSAATAGVHHAGRRPGGAARGRGGGLGAVVRTRATVRDLARIATGWRLGAVGSAAAPEEITGSAVVLALPARPAGRLLGGVPGASTAAAALGGIEYASMAIVTLAYHRSCFPAIRDAVAQGAPRSGYLVPAVEKRAVKAVTFSTVKWPHLAGGAEDAGEPVDLIRCSIGRIGEEGVLQRDDRELAVLAAADLAEESGAQGTPLDARVTRWGGGLPRYTVGHLDRVAAVPGRPGRPARAGRLRCGLRRDRHPGLHRHRAHRGRAHARLPARPPRPAV